MKFTKNLKKIQRFADIFTRLAKTTQSSTKSLHKSPKSETSLRHPTQSPSQSHLQVHEIPISRGRINLLLLLEATVVAGCHIHLRSSSLLRCFFLSFFSGRNPKHEKTSVEPSNLVRNSLKLHFCNISIEQLNAFSLIHTTISSHSYFFFCFFLFFLRKLFSVSLYPFFLLPGGNLSK
jgi:hypothetical protein